MPARFPVPRALLSQLGPLTAPVALVLLLLWGIRFVAVLPAGYDMPLTSWLSVWWPLGAVVALGAALGLGRRGLAWWHARQGRSPDVPSDPVRSGPAPRWTWLDSALLLASGGLGVAVVSHYSAAVNPEGALLGVDAPSYLENILVVARGNWERYNTDKYVLHGQLGAWLGWLLGGDHPRAARLLAGVCTAGLPALTYLGGRAIFGRVVCALAAAWILLDPLLWTYAVQTTNYALFAAVVGASLAAAAWVLVRPRWWTWLLAGLTSALCASTMEKAPLVLGPIWLTLLAAQAWRRPPGGWRSPAAALGLALVLVVWLDPPRSYTPFGSLVVNQREELHVEMPGWTWDRVQRMDPARPTPISPWLPGFLRNGAFEATLASLLAPPDADVLRLVRPDEVQPARFVLDEHTSIPPLGFRLRFNMVGLRGSFGPLFPVWLGLVLLGIVALVLPTPRGMERRRLPALLLLLLLLSLFPPVSFKYNPRYLIHAFPALALLAAGGLRWLCGALVGGSRRTWRAVAASLTALLGLAWLAGLYLHDPAAWLQPRQALTTGPLERAPADLGTDAFNLSMARAAGWLEGRPEPVIHDCGPVMMWLLRPWDPRFATITPAGCREVLTQARPAGELLIISDRDEYRDPLTPRHLDVIRTGRWELLAAWGPAPVPEGASPYALRDHVAVYRSK